VTPSAIGRSLVAGLLSATLAGCGPGRLAVPRAVTDRAEELPKPIHSGGEFLAWASTEPWLVIVDKEKRVLSVYQWGRKVRAYPAVFGRREGRKLFEGDRRTPSGLYRIVRKRPHGRFHRFFDLDYPNDEDRQNLERAIAAGLVPVSTGRGRRVGAGGAIGIHGTDDERLNRLAVDWTLGCVSLLNEHMDELEALVPEGTPVLIRDGESPFPVRLLTRGPGGDAEPQRGRKEADDRREAIAPSFSSEPPVRRHAREERSDRPLRRSPGAVRPEAGERAGSAARRAGASTPG
jgi:hypothetical protein